MKFEDPLLLEDLARFLEGSITGEKDRVLTGLNEIHKVVKGDLTFCDVEKYLDKAIKSKASVILTNFDRNPPEGKSFLIVEDPFAAFNKLIRKFQPNRPLEGVVHSSALIHPSAVLEPNVIIGPHVKIGAYSHIRANVTIKGFTTIGEHVLIQSGTVIASDAFYFKTREDHFEKLESCGSVIIGDRVEIGALCTIDRGVTGDTIIGEGTKIDNQVHIGHGVIIGRHCLLAAQVGIAGKCIIGNHVKLWGQVGVAARLTIGDHAEVYAQSGVSRNLESGKAYFGSPAIEAEEWFKDYRAMKRAPSEVMAIKKFLNLK